MRSKCIICWVIVEGKEYVWVWEVMKLFVNIFENRMFVYLNVKNDIFDKEICIFYV